MDIDTTLLTPTYKFVVFFRSARWSNEQPHRFTIEDCLGVAEMPHNIVSIPRNWDTVWE